jgi:hypothetical protein
LLLNQGGLPKNATVKPPRIRRPESKLYCPKSNFYLLGAAAGAM